MKYCTALRASSPRIPLTSRSWWKLVLRLSIVLRVSVLMPYEPKFSLRCSVLSVSVVATACSRRLRRILVRIPPKTAVAISPAMLSMVPMVESPLMRTVSPTEIGRFSCCVLLTASRRAAAAFSWFWAFSAFRLAWRSLRCCICAILRAILSSFSLVSMSCISSLKASNS